MIFGEKVRVLSGRRFDQSCREIELRECRHEFVFEIGAQAIAPLGILAFGGIGDPPLEVGEKLTGMKLLAGPGDGVSCGHIFPSRARGSSRGGTVRDKAAAGKGACLSDL